MSSVSVMPRTLTLQTGTFSHALSKKSTYFTKNELKGSIGAVSFSLIRGFNIVCLVVLENYLNTSPPQTFLIVEGGIFLTFLFYILLSTKHRNKT